MYRKIRCDGYCVKFFKSKHTLNKTLSANTASATVTAADGKETGVETRASPPRAAIGDAHFKSHFISVFLQSTQQDKEKERRPSGALDDREVFVP